MVDSEENYKVILGVKWLKKERLGGKNRIGREKEI